MVQPIKTRYTPEEYLALEAQSDQKHEYYHGQIFVMSGAQPPHNRIVGNLYRHIANKLAGNSCEAFFSDQRIYVQSEGFYTYPDISVALHAEFLRIIGLDSLTNPTVIIEVLFETTKDYDRTRKFQLYKKLASLQNYILIEQDFAYIDCFVRQGQFWYVQTADDIGQNLHIPALDITVPLADIYERIEFPPTQTNPSDKR